MNLQLIFAKILHDSMDPVELSDMLSRMVISFMV